MFEKFRNQHGKGILKRKHTKTFEKHDINHHSMYFVNEGIGRIERFNRIEERHVKTIYS